MINIKKSPDHRRGSLRRLIKDKPFLRVLEATNGICGIIAENAKITDENGCIKEFDAMWMSSLCHASFKGKPDIELVDMSEKITAIHEIMEVTSKPIILDGDTGGQTEHFCRHVKTLERLGVSAIIIEDKKGQKRNSLYGTDVEHELEDIEIFADKILKGKQAQVTDEFMIFARIESLIAGKSPEYAMERAKRYVQVGSDGIVIHSAKSDGENIFEFATLFKKEFPDIPLVFIPTAYNHFTDLELNQKGADIIIYANHLMRSAYKAMCSTAESILTHGSSKYADENYCEPVRNILNLIDGDIV